MTTAKTGVFTLAVLVLIGGYVVLTVGATVDIGEMQDFNDRAEAWCDAEGGDLYVANAIGHGGLHCTLNLSTAVHMSDVAALGYTHDIDAIQARFNARTGPLGVYGWGLYAMIGLSLAAALLAYAWMRVGPSPSS